MTQDVKLMGFSPSTAKALPNLSSLIATTLALWQSRARQDTDFTEMNEAQLKDIGLSGIDIGRLPENPFWV